MMQLEDIEEEQQLAKTTEKIRMSLDPNVNVNVKEQRRGSSSMLSAAGIGYEKRRSSFQTQDGRVFQQGNQVLVEDKDGKVTRLEILEVKEKMGLLRKAVPTLPLCLALLLCLINCVLPGVGTFFGALSLFCCGKCRHEKTSDGFKYGMFAAILQMLTCILLIGWIYSVYYGVKMIQDSITKAAVVNPSGSGSQSAAEKGAASSSKQQQPVPQVKTQAWA